MFTSALRRATPIPVHGVSGNYAQAVYQAAVKKNSKPQVAKDLAALQGALGNDTVNDFMSNPFVDNQSKLK